MVLPPPFPLFFFFNDTATTEIYTLSLHDALPICPARWWVRPAPEAAPGVGPNVQARSEEHTSELQSRVDLVCRLLLEKKKHPTDSITLGDESIQTPPYAPRSRAG